MASVCFGKGGEWVRKADMPTAKIIPKTVVIDDKIYAIGGGNNNNPYLKTTEMYDITNNVWSKVSDMNVGRLCHMAAEYNNKIYVFGGTNPDGTNNSTMEIYDPLLNKWTLESMPFGLCWTASTILDNKIYFIGGWDFPNIPTGATKSVYVYDPQSKTWEQKADLLFASNGGEAVTVNGKIYHIGGFHDMTPQAKIQEYDPITNTWKVKKDMPIPRAGFSLAVINNKIYAIGGHSGIETTNVMDVYDPITDEWTDRIEIPTSRSWTSISEFHKRFYIIGGTHFYNGVGWTARDYLSLVEEFTPNNEKFSVNPQEKLSSTWGNIK